MFKSLSVHNFNQLFVCLLTWDNEEKQTNKNKYLRGTMRTFLFLSLLSALCPAAQSPIVNRGVWLQISWKKRTLERLLEHSFGKGWNQKKGRKQGWGKPCPCQFGIKNIFFHLESSCFKIRFPQMHFLRTFVSLMGNNVWLNVLQVPNCCWPYGQKANVTDIAK